MDKKILNEELQQMKYLFGYKAGKVISEQRGLLNENPPAKPPKTKPTKPQVPTPKQPAKVYKIEGINADNIEKFRETSDEFLRSLGLFYTSNDILQLRNNWVKLAKQIQGCTLANSLQREDCKQLRAAQTKFKEAQAFHEYFNEGAQLVFKTLLSAAADMGWKPETISSLTKNDLVKALQNYQTGMPYTQYYTTFFPDDTNPKKWGEFQGQTVARNHAELIDLLGGDELIEKLKRAVETKMKELGIQKA